ncbi:hypothetical protein TNCV_2691581 [Trichonephila clavipes]|uniref:Secreted protein n=1 Tax=Trichonephila clavipes TaxID=2585209 RepID=A0A8X6VYL8_TRICX|nr:hypothetical protein TNCV_2691581 [Trichonephila clavipes]
MKQLLRIANFVWIALSGCFVEFYAPCSQACSAFGQFPEHCVVSNHHQTSTLLWPLFNCRRNNSFSSLYQIAYEENLSLQRFESFFQTLGSHWTNAFFYALECPELLQSCWCAVIILVK